AQRFYDATEFCWKKAQNIKAGAILLGLDKDYEVELALASNGLQEYFSITVEPYSNFFVSKQNILVHNAAVLLRAFSDPRVGEAVAVAGAAVGEYFFGKDDRSEKKQKNKTGGQRRVEGRSEYKKSGGEPPREPDEDNEVKKGHIKFVNKEKILEDRNRIRDHVIRPEKHKLRGTKLEKEPEKMVEKVIDKTIELDRKGELIICEDGTFRTDLNDVFGYNLRHRGKILETGELKVGTIYRK
ncbi:hypothetical protein HN446_03670, partial [bacterium]|nr:hypothetical protein [bacterium]